MTNLIKGATLQSVVMFAFLMTMLFTTFSCTKEAEDTFNITINTIDPAKLESIENQLNLILLGQATNAGEIQGIKETLLVLLDGQQLAAADRVIIIAMLQTVTNIALAIQDEVAENQEFILEIKDLALLMWNALQNQGGQLDDIQDQLDDIEDDLSDIWFMLFQVNDNVNDLSDDLGDIEDALGGLEVVLNNLWNSFSTWSQNAWNLLMDIYNYAQGNSFALQTIQTQMGVMSGNQLLILQGQGTIIVNQANFAGDAQTFYATTNLQLTGLGFDLANLINDHAAFVAMYNVNQAAASALWAQIAADVISNGQGINGVTNAVAVLQGDVTYIRTKVDQICAAFPAFAQQLTDLFLQGQQIFAGVNANGDAIAAMEASVLAAIAAGNANVNQNFASLYTYLGNEFGNINLVLLDLLSGQNSLSIQIGDGFAANQTFMTDMFNQLSTLISNGNIDIINVINNNGGGVDLDIIVNLLTNILTYVQNWEPACNNCWNACSPVVGSDDDNCYILNGVNININNSPNTTINIGTISNYVSNLQQTINC